MFQIRALSYAFRVTRSMRMWLRFRRYNRFSNLNSGQLMINISLRNAKQRLCLQDSFISCKNMPNDPNFIEIGGEAIKP
jgi:hypothetical protein